ncbi:MAG: hypothetical protein J6J33_05650 [Clostridia bacterium]|nr:hypothetical protein [Clostridia bacterium]
MKKTLKLVLIFMGIVLVAAVGGLSGYALVTRNKTWYIFDVRLVEPHPNGNSYMYTTDEVEFKSIKNKRVYMTTAEENFMEIAVYAITSNNTREAVVVSSDPSVAKVVFKDERCYINYLKAGKATITTDVGGVRDSFTIEVFDQVAEEFSVYDKAYYGDYHTYFPNSIIGYSDMIEYKYDYSVISSAGESADDVIDNDLLKIDETTVDTEVFDKVEIDPVNHTVNVKCKTGLPSSINSSFVVQSYYYSDDGVMKIHKNFVVDVRIITYDPEFLQVELATTPDFENSCVFMDTMVIDSSTLTEEIIKQDDNVLEEYLAYKKAENYLFANKESAVYKTLFSEKVSKIYVKFRKVYTNGDIVYLNPLSTDNPYTLTMDNSYVQLAPTKDFYLLTISPEYFDTHSSFDIGVSLSDFDLSHTFKFEFANHTLANVNLFYKYDETTGIYEYKYWDPRNRFDSEYYDEAGNVVGFYE